MVDGKSRKFTLTCEDKIDKESVIPIYYQLAKLLERKILLSNFGEKDMLPTENELAEYYGISRMTVRRAISELVKQNLVLPKKGKGTYINKSDTNNIVFEMADFFTEKNNQEIDTSSKLIEAKVIKAKKNDHVTKKLNLRQGEKYLYSRSLFYYNKEPVIYDIKYFRYIKQKPLLELGKPNLFNTIAKTTDYIPSYSIRVLNAVLLHDDEALLLNVNTSTAAFLLEQLLYDDNDMPICWSKSLYRGDRYKLTSKGNVWI